MIRVLCVGAIVIIGGLTSAVLAQTAPAVNLALNQPFYCNVPILPGWTGLVDGDNQSDSAPGCFATSNVPDFPQYVVIDLGGRCTINKVAVYNSTNGNTRKVSIFSSQDNKKYDPLREGFIFPQGEALVLTHGFANRPARYVKIVLHDTWGGGPGGDNCLFLREVEVFGWRHEEEAGDLLSLAAVQPPFIRTRVVDIFSRYALNSPRDLNVAVLGDSMILHDDDTPNWAQVAMDIVGDGGDERAIDLQWVGGQEATPRAALQWLENLTEEEMPDLVFLAFGKDAVMRDQGAHRLRGDYQALVNALLDQTGALVVSVMPPPLVTAGETGDYENRLRSRFGEYSGAVRQVVMSSGLPLVDTASVVARWDGEPADLFEDTMQFNPQGHKLLGRALADLLLK